MGKIILKKNTTSPILWFNPAKIAPTPWNPPLGHPTHTQLGRLINGLANELDVTTGPGARLGLLPGDLRKKDTSPYKGGCQ